MEQRRPRLGAQHSFHLQKQLKIALLSEQHSSVCGLQVISVSFPDEGIFWDSLLLFATESQQR